MFGNKFYLAPIWSSLFFLCGTVGTYILSVLQGHVEPILPYISELAFQTPEMSIFAFVTNFGSAFFCVVMYVRSVHLREFFRLRTKEGDKIFKIITFYWWCALAGAAGVAAVGCFPGNLIPIAHVTAGNIGFNGYLFATCLDVYFSFKTSPEMCKPWMAWSRLFFALMQFVTQVISDLAAGVSYVLYKGKLEDMVHWKPADGGHDWHVVSTFTEWTLSFFIMMYILSLSHEFRLINVGQVEISWIPEKKKLLNSHPTDSITNKLPEHKPKTPDDV